MFLTPGFAQKIRCQGIKKQDSYQLNMIDGTPTIHNRGRVEEETPELELRIGPHRERIAFDITQLVGEDVVLGLPWLEKNNPDIDWTHRKVTFREGPESIQLQSVNWPGQKKRTIAGQETKEVIRDDPSNPQIRWSRSSTTNGAPTHQDLIPVEHREYRKLFEEEPDEEALPAHQPYDHEIKLKEGTHPTKKPIYPLSAEKLEALRKYLDKN